MNSSDLDKKDRKIVKLQTYDSSLFIGQSYFINNGLVNFLISQPIFNNFVMSAGNIETIVTRQSKRLSNEKRSLPTCILFATHKWYNLKKKVEFKKSCLK